MTRKLLFNQQGFLTSIDAVPAGRTADYAQKCSAFIAQYSEHPSFANWTYGKSEILLRWVAELAAEAALLDVVEELIGPDILLWNAFMPLKPPHSQARFGWHQDATYWPLTPLDQVVTAWVALSPADRLSGGMQMLRGSHQLGQVTHETTYDKESMLRRGQQASTEIDNAQIVDIDLKPGQASIHHTLTLHRSDANQSDNWRMGIGFNYLSSSVEPLPGFRDSAILLRGKAGNSGLELTEPPQSDLDRAALANYARVQELQSKRYEDVQN